MATERDLVQEVEHNRKRSVDWLDANLYPEWEAVFQNYSCYRDRNVDHNDKSGNTPDPESTSIALPDTWGWIRRLVARVTAQIPNMRHRSNDLAQSELISRTLMYQWDRGGAQKPQKRHALQAGLFGWSVKAWYLDRNVSTRRKKLDVTKMVGEAEWAAIAEQYQLPEHLIGNPQALFDLTAQYGRGKYLPIQYDYLAYEGPCSEVLFVGDCYPQPGFRTIQESQWFIVDRRRSLDWIERTAMAYPEFREGFDALLKKYPNGTESRHLRRQDKDSFYSRLERSIGKKNELYTSTAHGTGEWTFTEMHVPGRNPKLLLTAEDDILIGEIPYPYDLDGKIAFTECVLIDNILHGIGDSTARVLRGLQELHNRQFGLRYDVMDAALRPLMLTSDIEIFDNPERIKRGNGLRIVYGQPGSMSLEDTGPALASIAASLNDEGGLMRMFQVGTGDSNMSMAANVDPAQLRTATGARIAAYNQDVLTKDMVDRYTMSLSDDAEMMFLLNRSEMSEGQYIDLGPYVRNADSQLREMWTQVEPDLFNLDGQIVVEAGSTMADDDEAKIQKAREAWQMFNGHPMVNQMTLLQNALRPFAPGGRVEEFIQPPPPPMPEEKDKGKVNLNFSVTVRYEDAMADPDLAVLIKNGLAQKLQQDSSAEPAPPPPGAGPGGDGAPPPPPEPPPLPMEEMPPAAMASMAARGRNPLGDEA